MPTFDNLESLASVRAKINNAIQNSETAVVQLADHETRIDALELGGGGGTNITVQDEGGVITAALDTINFVGAGVTVTGGATATVTIPGAAGSNTNLAWNAATSTVTSDTGTDATLTAVDLTNPGLMSVADKTKLNAITGTNTGDQTSIVGITGTKAQFDTAVTDGNFMYVGDAPTAHTHTLANITDVTVTVANLNTLDDGVDTTLHFHAADRSRANHTGTQASTTISDFTEAAQDAVGGMVDASLVYNDATPNLQRAALTGAVTAAAGSNTTALGSFTKAQLNTAISDGDAMYVGDAPTAHTHTLANISDVTMTVANLNSLDDGVNSTLHFHNTDRDRANHTGTQTSSTISDFSEAVDDRVSALVVAGTNMTVTYNDVANTLTLDAAGGGAGTNLTYTAATRVIASDTGTDATLPLVTSGEAGLAPASGGGAYNFLRADGTWALVDDYTTTVTSVSTVTLTVSSKDVQVFTGSTSQTVVLPVVSTLTLGRTFRIRNASTSTITVQSSGGNTINSTVGSNMDATYTCIALTGTDATSWLSRIDGASGRTGSGSATFNSSPTFTGTPVFPASVTGGASLRVPHGTAPSAPVDGDLWTTTASVFAQVNGTTIDLASGGGATNLSYTAATRVIASDTGTDATLPLVTTGDAGLAPASGGGTTNFLRADGTWAAPSGGGGGGAPQIMSWMI